MPDDIPEQDAEELRKRELPKFTPPENFVISEADRNVCLGLGELKPCPHCGMRAISAGRKNPDTGLTVYQVMCTGILECCATTHYCDRDPAKARAKAVEFWNRRVPEIIPLPENTFASQVFNKLIE